jgi:hypothetical protein
MVDSYRDLVTIRSKENNQELKINKILINNQYKVKIIYMTFSELLAMKGGI